MGDAHAIATDAFQMICDRLTSKAAELQLLISTTYSFKEWITWEAFLACKVQQSSYPFCEIVPKPTYISEGVADDGNPEHALGDLRVGASYDSADHRWVFIEFTLLHDGNRIGDYWQRKTESDIAKLLRLGWRRSASPLIVLVASQRDVLTERASDLANLPVWNRPALTEPRVITLPDGGSVIVKAFDIKKDPDHTLTGPIH